MGTGAQLLQTVVNRIDQRRVSAGVFECHPVQDFTKILREARSMPAGGSRRR